MYEPTPRDEFKETLQDTEFVDHVGDAGNSLVAVVREPSPVHTFGEVIRKNSWVVVETARFNEGGIEFLHVKYAPVTEVLE